MANSAMDHYASAKTSSRDENDRIKYAASCMKGTRDEMQDYHTAILELDGSNPTSFFGVFDGHGGYNVALYCSKRFHLELVKDPDYENNPRTAIESVCFRIDKKLKISDKWKTFDDTPGPIKRNWLSRLKRAISQTFEPDNKGPQKEGSTACVALIRGNQIFVGNVGDSRCVLSRGGQAIDLSTDHKPDDPNERERIEAAGGKVVQDRVPKRDILTGDFRGTEPGIYRVDGGIAISRAIGDFHYKKKKQQSLFHYKKKKQQRLICNPDIRTEDITGDIDFLLIASDGIWSVKTSQEVVAYVNERLQRGINPRDICEALLDWCMRSGDNSTVILVLFKGDRAYPELSCRLSRANNTIGTDNCSSNSCPRPQAKTTETESASAVPKDDTNTEIKDEDEDD